MPSTTTLPTSGRAESTRPVFGASTPVITCTKSSFFTCMVVTPPARPRSDHLGGQADDLQIALVAQLAGDGAEDARAARVLVFLVQQHHRVAVEADVTAVRPARPLLD